jgi:hypothetical protein
MSVASSGEDPASSLAGLFELVPIEVRRQLCRSQVVKETR